MAPKNRRWTLARLMIVVAALSVALTLLRTNEGALYSTPVVVFLIPAVLAPSDRKPEYFFWAFAVVPSVAVISTFVTWFVFWCLLGRGPVPYREDPDPLGLLHALFHLNLSCLFATSISLLGLVCGGAVVVSVRSASEPRSLRENALILARPALWLAGVAFLLWDPLGVLNWIMD